MKVRTGEERRAGLRAAELMLLFTPELCGEGNPRERLAAVLPHVDVVQIRIKPLATETVLPGTASLQATAKETFDWALVAAELCSTLEEPPLLIVNDRVDVALALRDRGVDGVHLGQGDFPSQPARGLIGPDSLIGLSTHDVAQVAMAEEQQVDYVGFGPIFATETKGYVRAIGPEAAWIASVGSGLPLFPIGGIGPHNANSLAEVGRVAVSSALLRATRPQEVAAVLREALEGDR
jgi:thiamine-phosphate pyrophosphorylase